jgi:23S rRNA-/tRNA-specific pseudouridylate synthase
VVEKVYLGIVAGKIEQDKGVIELASPRFPARRRAGA